MHYKLTLSYDGTRYFGWQKTNVGPSIQEELKKALFQITKETVWPEAASRTDRGVHAAGQIVSFSLEKPILKQALNGCLPQDIRVLQLETVSPDFHPTLDAKEKEYHYNFCLGIQDPVHRLYSWHFPYPLDFKNMEEAAKFFLGSHDFSAFSNAEKDNPICTLHEIHFSNAENRLQIRMRGDRFLYKMARNIAGTLIYVGCGKRSKDSIPQILASKKRSLAGVAAPAHGLILYRVRYLG